MVAACGVWDAKKLGKSALPTSSSEGFSLCKTSEHDGVQQHHVVLAASEADRRVGNFSCRLRELQDTGAKVSRIYVYISAAVQA